MNRSDWLKEQRREAEERYSTLWAPLYGEKWGLYNNATHQHYVKKFLGYFSAHITILDAACGAGRYSPMLLEAGHNVLGIDQSEGMLSRARAKFPDIRFEKIGLQEMPYQGAFDGVICIDAMEHVCPEDWLLVLTNFHRALRGPGYLYFTVEIAEENEIEQAFVRGGKLGFPIIYGEWADGDVYHYYPTDQQVEHWILQAGFNLMEEGDGDGYRHFVASSDQLK